MIDVTRKRFDFLLDRIFEGKGSKVLLSTPVDHQRMEQIAWLFSPHYIDDAAASVPPIVTDGISREVYKFNTWKRERMSILTNIR
jgi:hypothetical protein